MSELNHGNRYERQTETRKIYEFITKADPTPTALKKATYQGMIERRKEQERKASAKRKRTIRTTAAAAALVLAITATPLRGYVVSAAGNVYNAIVSNWREDVFPVNLKKSDNGCTVQIIESRVANDFLYLTVKEYYPKELVSRDDETKLYSMPDIAYSGSIRDNKGNELRFDPSNIVCMWAVSNDHYSYKDGYEERVVTESAESAEESSEDFVVNAQYRVYLPELASVVNSADKKYTCTVDAVSSQLGSNLAFEFSLDNVNETVSNKNYALDRTFHLDGADVTFQKLSFSPSGADLIVRLDPSADLSEAELQDLLQQFDVSVEVSNDADVAAWEAAWEKIKAEQTDDSQKSPDITIGSAWMINDRLNHYGFVYDLDEDINADSMMWDKLSYMKMGGSYYYVISDIANRTDSSYDMEKIIRSDFTVEIEYLRWHSLLAAEDSMDLIAHYYSLDDVAITAEKVSDGKYSFADNHIKLPGERGDLDITLKDISETETTKLADGSYQHTLAVDADIAFRNWDGMAKDDAWENLSLVNSEGKEILKIGLNVDTAERGTGTTKPVQVKCVAVDSNPHFTLAESNLTLHVANVVETHTFEPNGWFNAKYSSENVELLNEQRFFHIQVK